MDKIDIILKRWSQKQKIDESKVGILTESICRKIRNTRYSTPQRVTEYSSIPLFRLKIAYTSLGVVIGVLLLIITQKAVTPTRVLLESTQIPSEISKMDAFSEKEVKNNLQIVTETKKVFPDNLRWVQPLNTGINLGLVSHLNEPAISSECVLLHLVVFRRQVGEKWQNVWSTEVGAVPEEFIKVPPDTKNGNCINFWTHRVTDDLWVVDTDIRLKFPFELTTSASDLIKLGKPEQILWIKAGDVEYCIFEIVTHANLNPLNKI
jgi:hypothetical protein